VGVEQGAGHIRARLSTFDTAMVVFSLVVGIGIFRTPAIVAGAAGGTSLFFTAWIAGGVISLIGALTFAEIGSRYPRAEATTGWLRTATIPRWHSCSIGRRR